MVDADEGSAAGDVSTSLHSYWDREASTYDRVPGHGLNTAAEAAAWRDALARHLPAPGSRVLDVGAGTGALSLVAAELGLDVVALDFSEAMLAQAKAKADERGLSVTFVQGSATEPPAGPFDAVFERHVLWTLPDPLAALRAWRRVAPAGRLVLFEPLRTRVTAADRFRMGLTSLVRRAMGPSACHHAPHPAATTTFPLFSRSLDAYVDAVGQAGWTGCRVERLHEVERARRRAMPLPLRWLDSHPRYALTAE